MSVIYEKRCLVLSPAFFNRQTEKIIKTALQAVGVQFEFLRGNLSLHHRSIGQLSFENISAVEWLAICELLHIPPDSLSFEYSRRLHSSLVRTAWARGNLNLPFTERVAGMISGVRKN